MPKRPRGSNQTKTYQNSRAAKHRSNALVNPTPARIPIFHVYSYAPEKNSPPPDNESMTAPHERNASAMIQASLETRIGLSASHQINEKMTANGAKVSFDRLPGIAHNGKRYHRPDSSDQVTMARKKASPEST